MKTLFTTFGLIGLGMVFSTCDSIKHCDAYTFQPSKDIQCDEFYLDYNCKKDNQITYSNTNYLPYYNTENNNMFYNPAMFCVYPVEKFPVIDKPRQNTRTYVASPPGLRTRKPQANKVTIRE